MYLILPPFEFDHSFGQVAKTFFVMLSPYFQGTLTNIVKTPEAAAPSEELLTVLNQLSVIPGTVVFVISGRDQKTLDEWIHKSCPHVGLR